MEIEERPRDFLLFEFFLPRLSARSTISELHGKKKKKWLALSIPLFFFRSVVASCLCFLFFVFRACLAFWRGRGVRSLAPSPPLWLLTPPRTPARGSVKEGCPLSWAMRLSTISPPRCVSIVLRLQVSVFFGGSRSKCSWKGVHSNRPACLRVVLQVEPRPQRLRGRTGLACLGGNNQLAWKEGKRETADRERGEGQLPPLLLRLAHAVKFGG